MATESGKSYITSKPLLIIISGLPCTGKTTLGKQLAQEFSLPFIGRDGIKELLFDSLGWKDREWSKKLGSTSYSLLYHFARALLVADRSFILESNFKTEFDTDKFLKLSKRCSFEPLQILCQTDSEVLFQRFKQRSESEERHPGHVDRLNYEEFKSTLLKGKYEPLKIGGEIFTIDTTNFETTDYRSLSEKVKKKLLQRNLVSC